MNDLQIKISPPYGSWREVTFVVRTEEIAFLILYLNKWEQPIRSVKEENV